MAPGTAYTSDLTAAPAAAPATSRISARASGAEARLSATRAVDTQPACATSPPSRREAPLRVLLPPLLPGDTLSCGLLLPPLCCDDSSPGPPERSAPSNARLCSIGTPPPGVSGTDIARRCSRPPIAPTGGVPDGPSPKGAPAACHPPGRDAPAAGVLAGAPPASGDAAPVPPAWWRDWPPRLRCLALATSAALTDTRTRTASPVTRSASSFTASRCSGRDTASSSVSA